MNKKTIYILLAIVIALALIYTFAFSPLTTGKAITNCESPENLDRYDCELFKEEISSQCGIEFYDEGCS